MIDTPSTTDDSTQSPASEDANALIDAASAIMRPVASAIRQRANGKEVDIQAALAMARTQLREEALREDAHFARLLWLEWWVRWALEHCEHSGIYNF